MMRAFRGKLLTITTVIVVVLTIVSYINHDKYVPYVQDQVETFVKNLGQADHPPQPKSARQEPVPETMKATEQINVKLASQNLDQKQEPLEVEKSKPADNITTKGNTEESLSNEKHESKKEIELTTVKAQKARKRSGKRYCVPHADLEKQHGLPGPCNDTVLVLDCPDPYMEYLYDPQVLNTCRVKNESSLTERRKQIIKGPGVDDCHDTDGVLVSNSSLPVSPKPQPVPGKVPRIIHYVSLSCNRTFTFTNYLSVFSVHKFIAPDRIYFHGDCLPKGFWWQRTVDEVPNIYFRQRLRTKFIQGKPPMWVEHETDIIRLQVLLVDGGIYLDTDVLVLAPVDDLLDYPMTLGRERPETDRELGSSFILSEAGSPFVCMWLFAFREYNPRGKGDWGKYAIIAPGRIATTYPNLIHTEPTRFFQPSWYELPKIYNGFYDWSNNYILHMWNKNADKKLIPKSPSEIPPVDKIKYTLQEVFRHLYFNQTIIHAKDKG